MTVEQRIVRLECLLVTVYDRLPGVFKLGIPAEILQTIDAMKQEQVEILKRIEAHEKPKV